MRVGEGGDGFAAAAAGALLVRLGFDVIRIAGPAQPEPAVSPTINELLRQRFAQIMQRGKTTVLSPARGGFLHDERTVRQLAEQDAVICEVTGLSPPERATYLEHVNRHNTGVWVTVSPYGLAGPKAGAPGDDLTVLASGGLLEHMRGSTRRPVKPAGFQASMVGGHFAAMAAMHGLLLRRDGRGPVHLDVSLQETVIVTGVFLEASHRLFDLPGAGGSARYAPPRGLVPCGEGSLYVVVLEDHQWAGLVAALGNPAWASGIRTVADRLAASDVINAKFGKWAASMGALECMERLQRHGVPATRVSSVADLAAEPGLHARGFFELDAGTHERVPRLPFTITSWPQGAALAGDSRVVPGEPPEQGQLEAGAPGGRFRVLDATHVLAGPLAMSWLGAMGVDVVKLEDVARPDVYRRRGPFPGGVADIETSAYFAACNYSKRSFGFDSSAGSPSEQIARLAVRADAVVENFGRHRARRYGLLPEMLWPSHGAPLPRLRHMVSTSGFGMGSPYESFRVYGQNVHAYGGLLWLTRDERGEMTNMGTSWADPLTAVWMTCLTLTRLLFPLAVPTVSDLSMVEAVAYEFPEFFSLLTRDGITAASSANEIAGSYPSGVYPCQGQDEWIAISIATDEQWRGFCEVVGEQALSTGAHAHQLYRREHRDELSAVLDVICARWPACALSDALARAGVPSGKVATPQDLVDDRHLAARGFYARVTHRRWGDARLPGLPWMVHGGSRAELTAAPLLGEHTADVEREWSATEPLHHRVRP